MRTQGAALPRPPQQRRWPRYKVNMPVRVFAAGKPHTAVYGQGTDMNWGGMRLFALLDLAIGDQIAIEFTTPYSGRLRRVRATVRNRDGNTYGVEFMPEDRENTSSTSLESLLTSIYTSFR
jgi:hypothetical protein